MNNTTSCNAVLWTAQSTNLNDSIFIICTISSFIHCFFWLHLIVYPSVRQFSMQWLYAYLVTDLLLLVRYFLFDVNQWWPDCISYLPHIIICFFDAMFDNYLNLLQSYILLALNVCRYIQIVHNYNVYSLNSRMIIVVHILIYSLPILIHIIALIFGWSAIEISPEDPCNFQLKTFAAKFTYLLLSYILPVILMLIFLSLCLKHIRNVNGIQTQQILYARIKYYRQLTLQLSVFYSQWILLLSPYLILFPFYHRHSSIGYITQILSYISLMLDPIVIAGLDVRFVRAWKKTRNRMMNRVKLNRIVPMPTLVADRH